MAAENHPGEGFGERTKRSSQNPRSLARSLAPFAPACTPAPRCRAIAIPRTRASLPPPPSPPCGPSLPPKSHPFWCPIAAGRASAAAAPTPLPLRGSHSLSPAGELGRIRGGFEDLYLKCAELSSVSGFGLCTANSSERFLKFTCASTMDDDWDAEDFTPLPPVLAKDEIKIKSQWDDEDLEEEVKEEEKPKPVAAKPKPEKKKEKVKKVGDDEGALADPVAEKLRQQRLVEEADYQNTSELFGGKQRGGRSLEGFIPKSEDDFLEYAELLVQKLRPFEKSFHYKTLLKALMRHSVASLNASDAKEVSSSMTVIANEKLKAEKDATAGKKKTGAKKKQLIVDKPDDDGLGGGSYDAVDDYDFM